MSLRYWLIFAILLWIVYEYTNHLWVSVWQVDTKTVKCSIGLFMIIILIMLPSVESLMGNTDINTYLRRLLVNEQLSSVYTTPTVSPEILHKMQTGASYVHHEDKDTVGGSAGVAVGAASPT